MNLIILLLWAFIMYLLFKSVNEQQKKRLAGRSEPTEEQQHYQSLCNRFMTLVGATAPEAFYQMSKDRGFGWSQEECERHYIKFINTGEFPNYVEMFLDKEEETINTMFNRGGIRHDS